MVLSDNSVAALGDFDDKMQRLQATGTALTQTLGAAVAPALGVLADNLSLVASSVSWPLYWVNATAPTSLSLSPGVFENTLRLSWSGAASGINNGISTYHCYYQYSDNSGGSWSEETGVNSGGAGYIDVDTTSWPRGRLIRFHVYSISTYNNPLSGYSGTARKNQPPNAPTGTPTTNRSIYSPGETIVLNFEPPEPRDPDTGTSGDIAGYEVKLKYPDGSDYSFERIMGTNPSPTATSVNVSTVEWTPGQQWTLFVRGYDLLGVRSAWSDATALITIGTPMKVLVSGLIESEAKNNGDEKECHHAPPKEPCRQQKER